MQPKIVFVLPKGWEDISGGNLYNQKLIAALKKHCELSLLCVEQWQEEEPREGVIYCIDSLNLLEFHEMRNRRALGQRFVLLVHHLPSLEPGLAPGHRDLEIEEQCLKDFDGFIVTGEFAKVHLDTLGYSDNVLLLQSPGLKETVVPRPFSEPVTALMVCNLVPRKGVFAFLQALDMQAPSWGAARLDIVGRLDLASEYAARCQELISSSSHLRKNVRLRGVMAHEKMAFWYQRANLFLSSSRMETFGLALQEARQWGLPLFVVKGGHSAQHVREGENGELYDSPEELAKAFARHLQARDVLSGYFFYAQRERERAFVGIRSHLGPLLK